MQAWRRFPNVFEINTWVWLEELEAGGPVNLGSVPSYEWDRIARFGFDAVWLMGVWERSPAGTAIANRNPGLLEDFRRALPDFRPEDNVGSPYCVRRYVVDPHLGGPEGLAQARRELARRGLLLILDFVPNHVAPDHPWLAEHREYFIQGTAEDAANDPSSYITIDGGVVACGRDPYFPAWPDVVQLNAYHAGLRRAAMETISNIATQCDGIRCDMAMLMLNSVVERTWGHRAGDRPPADYWVEIIGAVKAAYPNFIFMAEAYWDLEWELQQQGFDFCYDKRLYDRLEHTDAETVGLHLRAESAYQEKLVRFLENHDEPRAAAAFSIGKERAAAVTIATLPGARLFHEGQFKGRKVRLPVFLARRPQEPANEELQAFYSNLLKTIANPVFHDGAWSLCPCSGWPDNQSCQNLAAWNWVKDGDRFIVVVNLSDGWAQARVHVPGGDALTEIRRVHDMMSGAGYDVSGPDLASAGLYVELGPWGYHLFHCLGSVSVGVGA